MHFFQAVIIGENYAFCASKLCTGAANSACHNCSAVSCTGKGNKIQEVSILLEYEYSETWLCTMLSDEQLLMLLAMTINPLKV